MENDNIRLLYVEDEEIDALSFERHIKRNNLNYDYLIADSVKKAKELMSNNKFDILLMDYNLGDGTAFDIIHGNESIASILLTGLGDEEIAAKSIKMGAFDYLVKDIDGDYLKKLPNSIDLAIQDKVNSSEFKKYHLEIEELVKQRTRELSEEIEIRKTVEFELQRVNMELEERVIKRTQMLNQSLISLSETQNHLIESERAITANRLLTNLSQKLNTPVGTNITLTSFLIGQFDSVKNHMDKGLLSKKEMDEFFFDLKETLNEIQKNLRVSAKLVKEFKEFNKSKLLREITDITLNELVDEVIQVLSTKFEENLIEVTKNISEDLRIRNYPTVLRHILFNLFMHTIQNHKTSYSKGIQIHASMDDGLINILYFDGLSKIPDEILHDVFDTFYALRNGEKAKFIELNTVYTLIQEIEKGTVTGKFQEEYGNMFIIKIPFELPSPYSEIGLDTLLHKSNNC